MDASRSLKEAIAEALVHEERRRDTRYPMMQSATIWRGSRGKPLAACLCDRSERGLGLTSPIALAVGEKIEVGFSLDGILQRYRGTVVHCECFNDDTFRIGVRRTEEE